MTFDKSQAAQIRQRLESKDDDIDHDYWNAHAAAMFPAMMDRIAELEADKALFDQTCAGHCFELAKQLAEHKAIIPEPGDADRIQDMIRIFECSPMCGAYADVLRRYLKAMQ